MNTIKFVELYQLQNNGSQKVIATCALRGDRVVCEGNPTLVANLERGGILDYSTESRERLFPKDGSKFLEQLRYNFTSGYLNASVVKEKFDQ